MGAGQSVAVCALPCYACLASPLVSLILQPFLNSPLPSIPTPPTPSHRPPTPPSGATMAGAMQALRELGLLQDPSKRVVVLLADSIRNYMSKHLNDGWMETNGFAAPPPAPAAK